MLRDQKRRRFDTVAAWWDDVLTTGELVLPRDALTGAEPSDDLIQTQTLSRNREWGKPIINDARNDELFAMYNKHRGTDRGVSRSSDLLRRSAN